MLSIPGLPSNEVLAERCGISPNELDAVIYDHEHPKDDIAALKAIVLLVHEHRLKPESLTRPMQSLGGDSLLERIKQSPQSMLKRLENVPNYSSTV